MHGPSTLKRLNQQFARPAKPRGPSAVQRIRSLRDQLDSRAALLLKNNRHGLPGKNDAAFGAAYSYFVCELNELIDRIERDEKEGF